MAETPTPATTIAPDCVGEPFTLFEDCLSAHVPTTPALGDYLIEVQESLANAGPVPQPEEEHEPNGHNPSGQRMVIFPDGHGVIVSSADTDQSLAETEEKPKLTTWFSRAFDLIKATAEVIPQSFDSLRIIYNADKLRRETVKSNNGNGTTNNTKNVVSTLAPFVIPAIQLEQQYAPSARALNATLDKQVARTRETGEPAEDYLIYELTVNPVFLGETIIRLFEEANDTIVADEPERWGLRTYLAMWLTDKCHEHQSAGLTPHNPRDFFVRGIPATVNDLLQQINPQLSVLSASPNPEQQAYYEHLYKETDFRIYLKMLDQLALPTFKPSTSDAEELKKTK